MNSINNDSKQDDLSYRDVLEQSTKDLNPSITAQLNSSRRDAIASIDSSSKFQSMLWRPAIALFVPVIAVTMITLNTVNEELPDADFYSDLELLVNEEQLDFLVDLDISDWQGSES